METRLFELLQICYQKHYEVVYNVLDEQRNIIELDSENRIIEISIGDSESENLPELINDMIDKLQ